MGNYSAINVNASLFANSDVTGIGVIACDSSSSILLVVFHTFPFVRGIAYLEMLAI